MRKQYYEQRLKSVPYKEVLNEERIEKVLNYFKNSNNPARNISVFYLCIFYGITYNGICELKWDDIKFDKNVICIKKSWKPLIQTCKKMLLALEIENEDRNLPHEYVFYTHSKTPTKFSRTTIDALFNFNSMKNDDIIYRYYKPLFLKYCMAKYLFDNYYSLEDIMFLLSIESENLSSYFSTDEIINRAKENKNGIKNTLDNIYFSK